MLLAGTIAWAWAAMAQVPAKGDSPIFVDTKGTDRRLVGTVPVPEVLVLRSGEVFQGGVSVSGKEYVLTLPKGELRFPAVDVDFCCPTLQEAYQRKQAAIAPDNVQEHFLLSQWCVKQNLLAEAAQQLDAVAAVEPNHPMLEVFRQRLDLLSRHLAEHKSAARPAAPAVTSEELDRVIRGLPEGTVESFTQRIQPVLMNHCATAGCHGPTSSAKFQLARVTNTKTSSRRATQRNLLVVLQLVNHDDPLASPLLTVPVRPHGPVQAAIFTDRESAQYRKLVEWVDQATRHASGALPVPSIATQAVISATALEDIEEPKPTRAAGTHRPRSTTAQASRATAGTPRPQPRMNPASRPGPATGATAAKESASADPYDPEVFNKRFANPAKP